MHPAWHASRYVTLFDPHTGENDLREQRHLMLHGDFSSPNSVPFIGLEKPAKIYQKHAYAGIPSSF